MKPDEKIFDRWWAIFDAEIRQAARHFAGANLSPSDVGAVFQRVAYGAAERSLKTTIRRLKNSKGGATRAKTRKDDADAGWRTDARRAAMDYVEAEAAKGRTPRRTDVIEAIKRAFRSKGKEEALPSDDRVIGRLVDAMRREGKINLDQ
jgi:hypothetical protein